MIRLPVQILTAFLASFTFMLMFQIGCTWGTVFSAGEEDFKPRCQKRCACCSWNFTCCVSIFALIVGGMLLAVGKLSAGFCFQQVDMDEEGLQDMYRFFEGIEEHALFLEKCVYFIDPKEKDKTLLLDVVEVEGDDGEKVTMADKFV